MWIFSRTLIFLSKGMYSDCGSEWTLPAATVDELEEIRRANTMTPGGEWGHTTTPGGGVMSRASTREAAWYEVKSRRSRSRPHTSYTPTRAHPNTPNVGKYLPCQFLWSNYILL